MKPETNILEQFVLMIGRVIVPVGLFVWCASYVYTSELWSPALAGAMMAVLIGYAVVGLLGWSAKRKK